MVRDEFREVKRPRFRWTWGHLGHHPSLIGSPGLGRFMVSLVSLPLVHQKLGLFLIGQFSSKAAASKVA